MLNGFNTFEEYDYYLEQTEREELQADYERERREQRCPNPAKPLHTWNSEDEYYYGQTVAQVKDRVSFAVLTALSGVVNERVQFYPSLKRKFRLSKLNRRAMDNLQWLASNCGYEGNVNEMVRAVYTYSR
jgi:hypothetical protein